MANFNFLANQKKEKRKEVEVESGSEEIDRVSCFCPYWLQRVGETCSVPRVVMVNVSKGGAWYTNCIILHSSLYNLDLYSTGLKKQEQHALQFIEPMEKENKCNL